MATLAKNEKVTVEYEIDSMIVRVKPYPSIRPHDEEEFVEVVRL